MLHQLSCRVYEISHQFLPQHPVTHPLLAPCDPDSQVFSVLNMHYNVSNYIKLNMEKEKNKHQVTKQDSQLTNVARIVEARKLTGAEVPT